MMNRHYILLIVCVVTFLSSCVSTRMIKTPPNNVITLTKEDTIMKLTIADKDLNSKPHDDRRYFWVLGFSLYSTQGSYTGRLLHGEYVSKHRDGNLIDKGLFHKGLKSGKWYEWYSSGNLKTVSHWKKGERNGWFIEYFANGRIKQKGKMLNGNNHGKWLIGDLSGNVIKERYNKNGDVSTKKKEKMLEKETKNRFSIFKLIKKKKEKVDAQSEIQNKNSDKPKKELDKVKKSDLSNSNDKIDKKKIDRAERMKEIRESKRKDVKDNKKQE